MKNKRGFTLIELLAVIVLLSIIVAIAVPRILNMIEENDKKAYEESVQIMMKTARIQYEGNEITNSTKTLPITYTYANGSQLQTDVDILNFKGDKPFSGSLTLTVNKKVIVNNLVSKNKKWCANKEEDGKLLVSKCDSQEEVVVADKKACQLEVDSGNSTILYIDSVGDMYRFSNDVNSGNSYEGKTIKLRNNIDMSEALPNTSECNNLTFEPIGIDGKPFAGNFDGGANTISNLTINKPNSNNVGLFGVIVNSNIYGVNLNNFNITGNLYVAGLVGTESSSTISEISASSMNITGASNVGSMTGLMIYGAVNNISLKSGTIIANPNGGWAGAISGDDDPATNSIVEQVNVSGEYIREISNGNSVYWKDYKINSNQSGNSLTNSQIKNINTYQVAGLDTWIGGDNNNTGYYFDYESNSSNNIVLKSMQTDPIPTNIDSVLDKSGEYYLIKNTNDWKNFTGLNTNEIKVRLANDLNFSNKHFYMKETISGSIIEGGGKTISNVNLDIGNRYNLNVIGMFRNIYNSTIRGFNLNNVSAEGYVYVGGFIGYEESTQVREISASSMNINGASNVGSIVGLMGYGLVNNISLKSADVTATGGWAGAISGDDDAAGNSIVVQANVSGEYIRALSNDTAVYWNNYKVNSSQAADALTNTQIKNINTYQVAGLDTWISGDDDNSGYYYDYESNSSNNIVLKSTQDSPIPSNINDTLDKSGEYYLIKNTSDWKKFTGLNVNNIKVKLTDDLDFSNKHFYMKDLITDSTIEGGGKTISNVDLNIGKRNNLNVIGIFRNISTSTIRGFNIENVTAEGWVFVAGFLGREYGSTVKEISVSSTNVNGASNVGSVVGLMEWGSLNNILIKSATVTANEWAGIISGDDDAPSYSIVEHGTVSGQYIRDFSNNNIIYWSTDYKINGAAKEGGFSTSNINNLNYYKDKVETSLDTNKADYHFATVSSKNGVYVVAK